MDRPIVQKLSTHRLPKDFRGRAGWYVVLWWLVRDTLFLCSPQPFYAWRRFLLRAFGARIGRNVLVRPTARVTYPWKLSIDDDAWLGDFVELYTLADIHIGSDAVVSQNSYLCTGGHDHRVPSFDIFARPITVESQAWIAADVFVGPGVTVGYGAVVAARSATAWADAFRPDARTSANILRTGGRSSTPSTKAPALSGSGVAHNS